MTTIQEMAIALDVVSITVLVMVAISLMMASVVMELAAAVVMAVPKAMEMASVGTTGLPLVVTQVWVNESF